MGHRAGRCKRERELREKDSVERALSIDGAGSVGGDDEDFPSFEELKQATVFGVCQFCGSALVKLVDGYGCPQGCFSVSFSK